MSIIEKLKVAAAELECIKLTPDECMSIVTELRTQANTLRSTSEELQLCRLAYSEQADAHLATQRALADADETIAAIRAVNVNEFGRIADEAIERLILGHRAAVAQADSCKKNDPVFLTNSDPRACKCTMAQRVVGDGCDVCNPELAAEIERDNRVDTQKGI
jgi:hypothetical protein